MTLLVIRVLFRQPNTDTRIRTLRSSFLEATVDGLAQLLHYHLRAHGQNIHSCGVSSKA